MTASLHGRFCAHGIEGSTYCHPCRLAQIDACDHEWFDTGLTTLDGPISECDKCGVTAP